MIFKVAKTNGSINDVSKNLALDSGVDYMKILTERTDTSNASNMLEITHNLGYLPAFYTFFEGSDGRWYRQLSSGLGGSYADTSKIYIETDEPSQRVRTVIFANSQNNEVGTGNDNATGKLRIAKDGYNADEETDLRRFKFISSGGVFKIKEKKTFNVEVTADTGEDIVSYAHGLGYTPQVYVFAGGVQIPTFYFVAAGMSYGFDFDVDDTNLRVKVANNGGALGIGEIVSFQAQILLDKIN